MIILHFDLQPQFKYMNYFIYTSRQVNYREHMRRSLGLKICWKMETKIDETYHVESFCCP